MKKKSAYGLLTLTAAVAILLAACGSNNKSSSNNSSSTESVKFSETLKNDKKAIKGGTLAIGMVDDSAFTGIFSAELMSDKFDEQLSSPSIEALFGFDKNYNFTKTGAATIDFDTKKKTATIKIKDGVKWSDGQQVNAKDVEYAYEVIANKATNSERYTDSIANIVGMPEYNAGTANTISGIEMPDGETGQTVVINFKQMTPGMTKSGSGYIWETALPYHYLKDVPFADLVKSDKIRKTPLNFGPFVVSKVVPGTSVEYTPNKYYWNGVAKLDKVTIERVSTASSVQALKNKKYDFLFQSTTSNFNKWKDIDGYTNLGKQELSYTYLGFKVGKWDKATNQNVMDKNAKMSNKSLRQAMAYALNMDEVNEKFYYGTRTRGTTLIPDIFTEYHDKSIKGYPLDIKKANELLDKAGYKKNDGDYRTDPNGKKLTIKYANMAGDATTQAIAQDFIQQWKKIGLRVELTTGRLIEFNSFYDKLKSDDPEIDVYVGAWSLSSEPSPADLYSAGAPFNYARFNTEENTKLLNDIDGEKSFDKDYRIKAFKKWQEYMNDQAFVVPTQYRMTVMPVNNRVKNMSITTGSTTEIVWNKLELTSKTR